MLPTIQRMSKTIKAEAAAALNRTLDGLFVEYGEWIISSDLRTIENDEYLCTVTYFRNGDEVIAVPDFYMDEDEVSFTGSRGGEYVLRCVDLYIEE
jgi:hypothetical protein